MFAWFLRRKTNPRLQEYKYLKIPREHAGSFLQGGEKKVYGGQVSAENRYYV